MSHVETEREIRLAVVMYGGTSLAIYMNGISQEFLQLVRATSPTAAPGAARSSTARVYRKLAHLLAGTPLDDVDEAVLESDPPVRFVLDILSGTSAGGINAVMLAKALARNTDLEPLKRLWIDEGALEKLINDRRSASPRYPYREPVRSLFNSDRMYVELLNAFGKLNPTSGSGGEALVDDLELAVTGTDLTGELIQLRLADGVAREYDHKHVFEFRLVDGGRAVDEFTAEFDPLLAFAARTTSSLPAVFEPAVVREARRLAGRKHEDGGRWPLLFESLPEEERARHERHAFADGGYLDNKPFGHAIDRLSRATSGVRVTRKLYYLEPQPQQIDPDAPMRGVPNALENTLQVFSLARYETIRADIQRIQERNRLLDRVRTLDFGVLEDLPHAEQGEHRSAAPVDGDLHELIGRYGHAYGGYHRLRVARVTDGLANTVADHLQVPADDDVRRALRMVTRAWRNAHFRRNHDGDSEGYALESAFLRRFDLAFHARRAGFLLGKINQMFAFDADLVSELEHAARDKTSIAELVEAHRRGERDRVDAAWSELQPLLRVGKTLAQRAVFELSSRQGQRHEPVDLERALRAVLWGTDGDRARSLRPELGAILAKPSEEAQKDAAQRFFERHRSLVEEIARTIEAHRAGRIEVAHDALNELSEIRVGRGLASEVRELLVAYWRQFIHFDMVQYPLLEATGLGEERSPVEIHRISAADTRHYGETFADEKLKGTTFATFGAFLDERWREHDIRWGRFDGAERLIASLVENGSPEDRDRLITEAHLAILRDEFALDDDALEALTSYRATPSGGKRMDVDATKRRVASYLQARSQDLDLDPRRGAENLSRLVRVGGKLSDTLSSESRMPRALQNLVGFLAFAGSSLLDAAIPKTFANLLTSYWSNLALLFGVILILLDNPVRPLVPLEGGLVLGVVLVLIALTFRLGRSLLWGALAPAKGSSAMTTSPWWRRFGWSMMAVFLALTVATAYVEFTPASWRESRDVLGYPAASVAMGLAASSGEVACVLGQHVAAACAAPAGPNAAPAAAAADRLEVLTYLEFGFLLAYVVLLLAVAVAAMRAGAWWHGLAVVTLAAALAVAGSWENVRILITLDMRYDEMTGAWLRGTSTLARAQYLLVFASLARALPVVRPWHEGLPWSGRAYLSALAITGASTAILGVVGLSLDVPWALGAGLLLFLVSVLGVSFLFAGGYLGSVAPEGRAASGMPTERDRRPTP